jgi:catalase
MGDRGLPASWRKMDGFGSHTYQWINAAGERFWVKYHFKTDQGNDFLTQAEANTIAGEDADFHIRDLYNAIARKEYPSWTVYVQIMNFDDAKDYRFNPFDLTKVWPHADYPVIKVGKLTLNRNPENYFAQIEQASFEPSNFVPGIDASPDKMLLARIFSYADAHRYRIGVNYQQLPVNAPKSPVHTYSKDGNMRFAYAPADQPVYAPNSFGGPQADPARAAESRGWMSDGELIRAAATLHRDDNDWIQPGNLVRDVLDDAARDRLVSNIAGHVGGVTIDDIRTRALQYWSNVDAQLGARVAAALGLAPVAPTFESVAAATAD